MRSTLTAIALVMMANVLMVGPLAAQVSTPEGAVMDSADDIAYAPNSLTEAQLNASNADIITSPGMNVFRRYPREMTADMVKFYTEALALRSLNPIQLTATQTMILTGVGSMQIKLSAGQQGDRLYDMEGGFAGGTGIRFFMLTYPDRAVVAERFEAAGLPAPQFEDQGGGIWKAMVTDPGGFPILIQIRAGAKDHSDDGVGIGINVSDIDASRAFYREFVGLEELPEQPSPLLGTTVYPYRRGESTVMLYSLGDNEHPDNGSAGIQYVVSDAPMAAARGDHRNLEVQTPLNRLAGFGLVTVWLSDPDGVTNYFAQVGERRAGGGQADAN
jgi:catechol 2,3-dioxygenase-like lactoylglutathione lyase family enzyme